MLRFFIINTVKSLLLLLLASLAFVSLISLFPLIGSLWTKHLDIGQILKDNFSLLRPLSICSICVSPLFGIGCGAIKKYRVLKLLIIGVISVWLTIILIMILQTDALVAAEGIGFIIFASFWVLVAYSFYSIPILMLMIIILEKWTRYKPIGPVEFEYNKHSGLLEANFISKSEYVDFYEVSDIINHRMGLKFIEKVNDTDSFYWDFIYNGHKFTLHYNIYFGVVLFPDADGKTTREEESELKKLVEDILANSTVSFFK